MKKEIIKKLICFILALSMAAQIAICSYAGEDQPTEYIEDIKISYDKKKLTDAGYKVIDNNVNENSYGKSVYIGVKTTINPEDAITDIAAMNMNGRYSFDKYGEYLKSVQELADSLATEFIYTVVEYAKIYNADKSAPIANAVYQLLNKFLDDDIVSTEYPNGTPLGVIFTDSRLVNINLEDNIEDETELELKEELIKILYQGNSENINTIKKFLSLGVTETGTDTFLSRLKNYAYTEELTEGLDTARKYILEGYSDVKEFLTDAKTYADEAKKTVGGQKEYLKKYSEEDQIVIAIYLSAYNSATAYQFGSNLTNKGKKMTLFDVFTLPDQDEYNELIESGEEPECKYYMDANMADILAQALTKGQIGSLSAVPLYTLITNTYYSDGDINETTATLIEEFKTYSDISIYAGVDRTLFSHPEDIALTSASIAEMGKTGENKIACLGETYWQAHEGFRKGMIAATAVAGALTVGFFAAGAVMKIMTISVPHCVYNFFESSAYEAYKKIRKQFIKEWLANNPEVKYLMPQWLNTTNVMFVLGAVALVISFALMIVTLVKAYEKPKTIEEYEKIKYLKIPRILVHMKEVGTEKQYYNYYCAKLIDASDDDTDFMNVYGDLNGKDEHSEWLCLYYTKDTRCGTPLTVNSFVAYDSIPKDIDLSKYLAVHPFDSEAVINLNAYNVKTGSRAIYLYFEKTAETVQEEPSSATENESEEATEQETEPEGGLKGTLLSAESLFSNIVFLVIGAALSFVCTYIVMRRKRKEEVIS